MGPEMLLVPIPERLQNNLTNSNRNCYCPDGLATLPEPDNHLNEATQGAGDLH